MLHGWFSPLATTSVFRIGALGFASACACAADVPTAAASKAASPINGRRINVSPETGF